VLTGDVPYAGLTPLQAAIGVVQRYVPSAILVKACGLRSLTCSRFVLHHSQTWLNRFGV